MLITRGRWVSWDTETTGVNPREARIVELACVRFDGAAPRSCYTARFHPGIPIPEPASQVHGIWDKDVQDQPPLSTCPHLDWLLGYPYLVGYNVLDYDGPLLAAEVARHRGDPAPAPPPGLEVLVLVRWHLRHWRHRKLEEVALRLRVPLEAAHSAADDATAAGLVLIALVDQSLVPDDWQAALALQAQVRPQLEEERRRFRHYLYHDRKDGGLRCGFGKHCERRLTDIRADWFSWALSLADRDAAADPARAMPGEVREIFHAHAAGRSVVALGATP